VRVDTVPDPKIEEPTDAIIRVTSSGICGSDLLLYEVLGPLVPGGQAEYLRVPKAHYGRSRSPEGPPDDRFVYLSDVLPTAWQAVEYADVPAGETVLVLGLGPIGEMSTRIAQHRGAGRVIAVDLVPERLERARAHGVEALDLNEYKSPGRSRTTRMSGCAASSSSRIASTAALSRE